jgi:hypothetical protein
MALTVAPKGGFHQGFTITHDSTRLPIRAGIIDVRKEEQQGSTEKLDPLN